MRQGGLVSRVVAHIPWTVRDGPLPHWDDHWSPCPGLGREMRLQQNPALHVPSGAQFSKASWGFQTGTLQKQFFVALQWMKPRRQRWPPATKRVLSLSVWG